MAAIITKVCNETIIPPAPCKQTIPCISDAFGLPEPPTSLAPPSQKCHVAFCSVDKMETVVLYPQPHEGGSDQSEIGSFESVPQRRLSVSGRDDHGDAANQLPSPPFSLPFRGKCGRDKA